MGRILFIAILAISALPSAAHAGMDYFWHSDGYRRAVSRHHRPHHRRRHRHHEETRTVVIHVEPLGEQCVDQRIDVTSLPAQDDGKAKDMARMQWSSKTQFLVGGVYMDPDMAQDQRWLCSITDARDSWSGELSKWAGKLRDKDGQLHRCYFSARPCRLPSSHAAGGE